MHIIQKLIRILGQKFKVKAIATVQILLNWQNALYLDFKTLFHCRQLTNFRSILQYGITVGVGQNDGVLKWHISKVIYHCPVRE